MLKVFVDGIVFENTRQFGVQRVHRETWNRMRDVELTGWTAGLPVVSLPSTLQMRHGPRWHRFLRSFFLRRQVRRGPFDLFHSTYLTTLGGQVIPEVTTIYDLIVLRHADMCGRWGREQARQIAACVRTARRIISISQATADDLVEFYPEVRGRVRVVHPGGSHFPVATTPNVDDRSMSPAAIYVGDRGFYKNFRILLDAMREPSWPKEMTLTVVGSPWRDDERLELARRGLDSRVRHLGRLDDLGLRNAIRSATCLVSTSLIEGFGLPVIEGQTLGVPVVCADIPVYREISGGAARLFPPTDSAALAQQAAATIDPGISRQMGEAGLRNVARFSWETCAEQTRAVYEEAVRGR